MNVTCFFLSPILSCFRKMLKIWFSQLWIQFYALILFQRTRLKASDRKQKLARMRQSIKFARTQQRKFEQKVCFTTINLGMLFIYFFLYIMSFSLITAFSLLYVFCLKLSCFVCVLVSGIQLVAPHSVDSLWQWWRFHVGQVPPNSINKQFFYNLQYWFTLFIKLC